MTANENSTGKALAWTWQQVHYCPGCGQKDVTVGLDCVLRETRPVFRQHHCR